ncbi:RNA chaperone Hfq [Cupriavidus basilensis]|uniref:RNA chaperone Hfq n=1 Tax=Cupriavidus basilensis TaxID=68895 RepID=UPI003D35792B
MENFAVGPQNWLLNAARQRQKRVKVYLVSGVRLAGSIESFDNFVVLLNTTDGLHAIYKHAITSVQLEGPVRPPGAGSESDPKAPTVVIRTRRPIQS